MPELSKNNKRLSTTHYALLRHDCFNVLTNIDITAFIPTRVYTCAYNYRAGVRKYILA